MCPTPLLFFGVVGHLWYFLAYRGIILISAPIFTWHLYLVHVCAYTCVHISSSTDSGPWTSMSSSYLECICKDCVQMRSHSQKQRFEIKTSPLNSCHLIQIKESKGYRQVSSQEDSTQPPLCWNVPASAYSSSFSGLWQKMSSKLLCSTSSANDLYLLTPPIYSLIWHALATHQYCLRGNSSKAATV